MRYQVQYIVPVFEQTMAPQELQKNSLLRHKPRRELITYAENTSNELFTHLTDNVLD